MLSGKLGKERSMAWTWSWSFFLIATVIATIVVAIARLVMNQSNIHNFGMRADIRTGLRNETSAVVAGTIVTGAVLALITTAIHGITF
jgi:hypothetical protein